MWLGFESRCDRGLQQLHHHTCVSLPLPNWLLSYSLSGCSAWLCGNLGLVSLNIQNCCFPGDSHSHLPGIPSVCCLCQNLISWIYFSLDFELCNSPFQLHCLKGARDCAPQLTHWNCMYIDFLIQTRVCELNLWTVLWLSWQQQSLLTTTTTSNTFTYTPNLCFQMSRKECPVAISRKSLTDHLACIYTINMFVFYG